MTAARRPASSVAPQAPKACCYFPAPGYERHVPTLPPDEPVPGEIESWEAVCAVGLIRSTSAHSASWVLPVTCSPPWS